jgi:hypothetical protein
MLEPEDGKLKLVQYLNIKPKYQLCEKELEVFRTIGFLSDKVHTVY